MPDAISIGCQGGGPETFPVGRTKVVLYQCLKERVSSTHCDAIDHYGLVLRVDGSLHKFGPEGIARVRFAKKQRSISVDIQIPMEVWQPLDDSALRQYLCHQVETAVRSCVQRLKKDGHIVAEEALVAQMALAFRDYTGAK